MTEIESKPFYLSRSFWGLVVAVASPFAASHGIIIPPGAPELIVSALGGAVGLWGIFRRPEIKLLPGPR